MHTNQIGSLLVLHNLRPRVAIGGRDWSAWWQLHAAQVPPVLRAEVEREIARLKLVKEQIKTLEAGDADVQIGADTQRAVETKRACIIDSDDVSSIALQFVLADELEVNVFASSAEAVARSQGSAAFNVNLLGASLMEAQGPAMVTAPLAALPGGAYRRVWPGGR